MDYRGVLLIGILGGAAVLASTSSCSAPDPGTVNFIERPRNQTGDLASGGSPTPTDGGSSSGTQAEAGTDGGSTSGQPVTAFTGAPPFNAAGMANGTSQNASHPNGGNPVGMNCMDCHKAGGAAAASIWGVAGTVYTTTAGTAIVAKAEVRVVDAAGKELALVYTDALGNFWADTIVGGVPGGAKAGIRTAAVTKLMTTAMTTQDAGCQKAGCHVAGAQGRISLQ